MLLLIRLGKIGNEGLVNMLKKLKAAILKDVAKYSKAAHEKLPFKPGDKVHYAGRVFDHKEVVALIDSSLDFWLTLGEKGRAFEKEFSNYLGSKFTVVVNSGSSANLLAVSALCAPSLTNHLKAGDEVITTAMTFPTTLAPIIQNGLKPVFVDIDPTTYNIDVSLIEKAITKKTKAIMIAHTLGNPCQMDEIIRLKKKYNLFLIEDTCDALDSRYNGKLVGTFGDISTFSFYAAHHITMGEGGAVVTNNPALNRIILSLRDWGRDCWCQTGEKNSSGACHKRFDWSFPGLPKGYDHKYVYSNIGYNLKPLDLQCAIGLVQLKRLPGFSKKRKINFERMMAIFRDFEDSFVLPKKETLADPSWFAFPLTVRDEAPFTKKDFLTFLEMKNIETRSIFAGNILKHPGYRNIDCRISGNLKNTDKVLFHSFFLGVYPGMDLTRFRYVHDMVRLFFKTKGIKPSIS